jgi:hypothetical protein
MICGRLNFVLKSMSFSFSVPLIFDAKKKTKPRIARGNFLLSENAKKEKIQLVRQTLILWDSFLLSGNE